MKKIITILLGMCFAVIAGYSTPNDFHKKKLHDVNIESSVDHDNSSAISAFQVALPEAIEFSAGTEYALRTKAIESYSEKIDNRFNLTNRSSIIYRSRCGILKNKVKDKFYKRK